MNRSGVLGQADRVAPQSGDLVDRRLELEPLTAQEPDVGEAADHCRQSVCGVVRVDVGPRGPGLLKTADEPLAPTGETVPGVREQCAELLVQGCRLLPDDHELA